MGVGIDREALWAVYRKRSGAEAETIRRLLNALANDPEPIVSVEYAVLFSDGGVFTTSTEDSAIELAAVGGDGARAVRRSRITYRSATTEWQEIPE